MNADIMFIAQNPGITENRSGWPMDNNAKTGKEFNWLLQRNGFQRSQVYVSNLVKCYRPNDKDPDPEHVEACRPYIYQEIAEIKPKYIVTIGAYSAREFIADYMGLEAIHGIPFQIDVPLSTFDGPGFHTAIIIPMWHTAAGLHDPNRMLTIQMDFARLHDIVAGKLPARHVIDSFSGIEEYEAIESVGQIRYLTKGRSIIAVDTEDKADGSPWSLQFSCKPGTGYIIYADGNPLFLQTIQEILEDDTQTGVTTVLHNSIHDLPVLEKLDIRPAKVADSMVMAYLLQSEPQGLKPLAYRHHGMEMHSFGEQVAGATRLKALQYLAAAAEHDYPNPEPVLTWPKGMPHIKQPQNIKKKIERILMDATMKDPPADPYDRWNKIKAEEGRGQVEEIFGPMTQGYLEDIDPQQALYYASRDPDATLRAYNSLKSNIESLGLDRIFDIDMNAIPMGIEMMRNGFAIDAEYLRSLSGYFYALITEQENAATQLTGESTLLSSPEQVGVLLFDKLKLPVLKRTKITRSPATGDDILEKLKHEHPVVPIIQKHRKLNKLKGTYTDSISKLALFDPLTNTMRIHTTLRFTRTATGRLSSADPNLQNIPVRTEEGRKIRAGFIASDGCLLLSCDYKGIELRAMAHESQDKHMLDTIKSGKDIHTQTASDMFGVPYEQVDKRKHRYPAKCFHPDTEVLTRVGWKKILDLNFGEEVIQAAPGLHGEVAFTWTVPRSVFSMSNEYSFLYHFYNNSGIDITVTPDHGMIVWGGLGRDPWRRIDAQEFTQQKFKHWANAGWLADDGKIRGIGRRLKENTLRLAVATQADGSYSGPKIRFGFTKKRKINRLTSLLLEHKLNEWTISTGKNGVTAFILNTELSKRIKGILDGKSFPWSWLSLTERMRNVVLDEARHWDSHKAYNWTHYSFSSTDEQSIDVLQAIATLSGRKASKVKESGQKANWSEIYKLAIKDHPLTNAGNVHVEKMPYNDIVACLEVDSHCLLVRSSDRNSKQIPIVTHNSVNFLVPYSGSAAGLLDEFLSAGLDPDEWTIDRCQEFIDQWFDLYPDVKKYFDNVKLDARKNGYVKDYFGRIRYIPGVRLKDRYGQEEALRQAGNMPIQALAAEVIKIAMADTLKVAKEFQRQGIICRPLLQIHDDLIFEVQISAIDDVAQAMQITMEDAVKLRVPTPVDPKIGLRWSELEDWNR